MNPFRCSGFLSPENKHAGCSNSENVELVIYSHSLNARTILVKVDAPGLTFLRVVFTQRRNIDVRLGVDRDLNVAALVVVQEAKQAGNIPQHLLSQSHDEAPAPEKTTA